MMSDVELEQAMFIRKIIIFCILINKMQVKKFKSSPGYELSWSHDQILLRRINDVVNFCNYSCLLLIFMVNKRKWCRIINITLFLCFQ